jgi:hypothetical protein
MPLAGFEPTIPVFKRAKIFYALDRAPTVTGLQPTYSHTIYRIYKMLLLYYITCVRDIVCCRTIRLDFCGGIKQRAVENINE